MAAPQVREHEVDALLASGSLAVRGTYHWKYGSHKGWLLASIPVEDKAGKTLALRLIVSVNDRERGKRSFSLMWNKNIRVRGLDISGSHRNKHTDEEKWVRRTHKHKWTDQCQDRTAYTPSDITAHEVREQFKQFCAECGIQCQATLAELPTGRLPDDL
jgi:hypothetical protein